LHRADALPPVLADLDGLGEPGAPVSGTVFAAARAAGSAGKRVACAGQPGWGVVDPDLLRHWLADAAAALPPAPTS